MSSEHEREGIGMDNANVTRRSTEYGVDLIDGREVARLIVAGDYKLTGTHAGGIHVEAGHFQLLGTLQGGLALLPGSQASISGKLQGSLSVAEGVVVAVTGAIEGSAHISRDGQLIIEPRGRLGGSLANYGVVVLRGVFGGSSVGTGDLRVEGDGYIKQPVIRDGAYYYEW